MRRFLILAALALGCHFAAAKLLQFTILPVPMVAHAQAQDLRAEIIARCRADMGQYGAAMVKGCVDLDLEAAAALSAYPEAARPILQRCYADMGQYGWNMVKGCVDLDLEAERELQELEGNATPRGDPG